MLVMFLTYTLVTLVTNFKIVILIM